LRTSELVTEEDQANCHTVSHARLNHFYGLVGYAVKAYLDIDIAPSMTFLARNGPTYFKFQNIPSGLSSDEIRG
jgi:hypothetical protein